MDEEQLIERNICEDEIKASDHMHIIDLWQDTTQKQFDYELFNKSNNTLNTG